MLNPELRPSFDDIFTEFQQHNFAIVPGVDMNAIRAFCCGVLAWEARLEMAHSPSLA
jgi:hypothetical protein